MLLKPQMNLLNKHILAALTSEERHVQNALSHEMRTPLAVIMGYADALQEELEGSHKELLQPIIDSAHRLESVIGSLLEYESPVLERSHETTTYSVASTVNKVVNRYRDEARKKSIAVHVEIRGSDWLADSHEHLLDRSVSRLLENALKFTETGEINVAMSSRADSFIISLEDTGIGLKEGGSDLFAAFTQGSTGLTRAYGGLGLGLYLVRRSAEAMGGSISLKNRTENGAVCGAVATLEIARNLPLQTKRAA